MINSMKQIEYVSLQKRHKFIFIINLLNIIYLLFAVNIALYSYYFVIPYADVCICADYFVAF